MIHTISSNSDIFSLILFISHKEKVWFLLFCKNILKLDVS
jgi:hypothetical protein